MVKYLKESTSQEKGLTYLTVPFSLPWEEAEAAELGAAEGGVTDARALHTLLCAIQHSPAEKGGFPTSNVGLSIALTLI